MVDKADFHFSTEVRVRLPETDAVGIAFHGWFFHYFEVARMDYLRNLGLTENLKPIKGFSNVVVRSACDFKSPARFDDQLVVFARISDIGTTSFRFEFLVYHRRENRLVATGETVHVAIDEAGWKPIPIPEDFRTVVRNFEGASLKELRSP